MDYGVAGFGYPAEALIHEPAQGIEAIALQVGGEYLSRFVDANAGVEHELVLPYPLDPRLLDIEFVGDLTHDLLEQVFDSHQARHAPVLVYDDGYVALGLLELGQQLFQRLVLRDEERLTHHVRGQGALCPIPIAEQPKNLPGVDDALDVVHVPPGDRDAAVARLHHRPHDLRNGHTQLDRDHVHPGHHDLPGDGAVEIDNSPDHAGLVLVERLLVSVDPEPLSRSVGCRRDLLGEWARQASRRLLFEGE